MQNSTSQESILEKPWKQTRCIVNLTSACGPAQSMSEAASLPVFDLSCKEDQREDLAKGMAECMIQTSCLLIRDPEVNITDNERFNAMMQRYFDQPAAVKMEDARPDVHYQVGVTPEGIELPRCTMDPNCLETVRQQPPEHRATIPTGPDPKWRFFWRLSSDPSSEEYSAFQAEAVIPKGDALAPRFLSLRAQACGYLQKCRGIPLVPSNAPNRAKFTPHSFPEWAEMMDDWGAKMLSALEKSAELLALGLKLPKGAFAELMENGPHLLGPTGVDLEQHMDGGNTIAGYHYDLNFMTIHGKSQFPGLFIWLADGRRVPVRIPEGCLLIQAGKQLEWVTAGTIQAGMHEVICSEAARQAVSQAKREGKSLWRTSSTVFGHVASSKILRPLGHFANLPSAKAYPPTAAGDYVVSELGVIALKDSSRE